jgi:Mn2+/Fe2+ NRAMP family transporter
VIDSAAFFTGTDVPRDRHGRHFRHAQRSAGAQFGYQTLFLMLLVTVGLVVVQEMRARLGAYTGEGLGALIREQFSIRVTTVAIVAFLLANVGLAVSEFAGIAAAMEMFGVVVRLPEQHAHHGLDAPAAC